MNTPLIGLGLRIPAESGHNLSSNYPNAVTRAGGMPIAIPVCCREFVEQYADMLDGLILTGGIRRSDSHGHLQCPVQRRIIADYIEFIL